MKAKKQLTPSEILAKLEEIRNDQIRAALKEAADQGAKLAMEIINGSK